MSFSSKAAPSLDMPVSYTHLDVYKRQATIGAPAISNVPPNAYPNSLHPPAFTRFISVSYTHPDVYKRQLLITMFTATP